MSRIETGPIKFVLEPTSSGVTVIIRSPRLPGDVAFELGRDQTAEFIQKLAATANLPNPWPNGVGS